MARKIRRLRSVKGFSSGDRVLASNAFGASYIGTVDHFEEHTIAGKKIVLIYVKDSAGSIIGRGIKQVKNLARESNAQK